MTAAFNHYITAYDASIVRRPLPSTNNIYRHVDRSPGEKRNQGDSSPPSPEDSNRVPPRPSAASGDELPLSWWTWRDPTARWLPPAVRCSGTPQRWRCESSICMMLVVWTIGVWWRVLVCITRSRSYCTTSFIGSHGLRLRTPETEFTYSIRPLSNGNGME